VSVVARPPRDRELLDALTRPIELDAATHEILVAENGAVAQAASRAQGDVILFLDGDVLAPRGLASAHGRRQAEQRRRLILGYTPYRVLHERTPADYGPRLRSRHYEARCRAYERDPGTVLLELWGGNLSLWHCGAGKPDFAVSSTDLSRPCGCTSRPYQNSSATHGGTVCSKRPGRRPRLQVRAGSPPSPRSDCERS